MKLNKEDKVALVETHIAMTLKELSAAQEKHKNRNHNVTIWVASGGFDWRFSNSNTSVGLWLE